MLFLFVWAQRVKIHAEPDGTSGHVWAHGVLREGVRNLPLWWALISAAALLFGLIYFVRYPGFGNFKGTLGWTSAEELQRDTEANNAKLEARLQPLRSLSFEQLAADPAAAAIGHRLYLDNCAACHGTDALGNQAVGAPNLTDAEWLYGGDSASVMTSILDGRNGVMPPLGDVLGQEGVNEVAGYVLSLSGTESPADWVAKGKARFDALCVACHGADGSRQSSARRTEPHRCDLALWRRLRACRRIDPQRTQRRHAGLALAAERGSAAPGRRVGPCARGGCAGGCGELRCNGGSALLQKASTLHA